ncbi:MAG: hypothetical protein GX786_07250 [Clostridiales bacterium]|nr:hypothetical protein [Clostridiales bacterium]
MLIGILIAYIALTVVAAVFHLVSYRKNNDMSGKAMLFTLAATLLAAVAFFTIDADGSTVGGYIYYINGKRMDSGGIIVGINIALTFMAFFLSHVLSVGIGYLFGHKQKAEDKGKPKVWVLVVSIIAIFFGSGFFRNIRLTSDLPFAKNMILFAIGAVICGLGIWGVISFIVKKKRSEK